MTIRELHSLAYTRLPKADVHDRLHEMAVGIGVDSLKACTPYQLAEIAAHVRMLPISTQHSAPSTQHSNAYGPRDRWSHKAERNPETLKRKRTGEPAVPGVIKIATRAQKQFIQNLGSEIGWTDEQLSKWLTRHFEVPSIEHLGTRTNANEAIRRLVHIKRQKAQERPR